jgi:hypothetical protein
MNSTQPRWDAVGGQSYNDWQTAVQLWRAELPAMAQKAMPFFQANLLQSQMDLVETAKTSQDIYGPQLVKPQNLTDMPNRLLKETNAKGYDQWKLDSDTIFDALETAWQNVYMGDYLTSVDGLNGAEREYAERQFYALHPVQPTDEELFVDIQKVYGNRFTMEDVKIGTEGRTWSTIEENQSYGQTDTQTQEDQIWDLLLSVPSTAELRNVIRQQGGDDSDLEVWYELTGDRNNWRSVKWQTFVEKFYGELKMAGAVIDLQPVDDSKLAELVQAQQRNRDFQATVKGYFGEEILNWNSDYGAMPAQERAMWKKANPEAWKALQGFYAYREKYQLQDKLWRKYYRPTTMVE